MANAHLETSLHGCFFIEEGLSKRLSMCVSLLTDNNQSKFGALEPCSLIHAMTPFLAGQSSLVLSPSDHNSSLKIIDPSTKHQYDQT